MKINMPLLPCLFIVFFMFSAYAHEPDSQFDVLHDDNQNEYEQHEKEEAHMVQARILSLKNAPRFSCQLSTQYGQCREYPIDASLKHKLADLKQSCESLSMAQFKAQTCPSANRVARCNGILLDYHDPQSLIYDNHYYAHGAQRWNTQSAGKTCITLEGAFVSH